MTKKDSQLTTATPVLTDKVRGLDDPSGTPISVTFLLSAIKDLFKTSYDALYAVVNLTSPQDGDILVYNSGEWVNQASSGGKGRVIFHTPHATKTLGAGTWVFDGGSTPVEQFLDFEFPNTEDSYREWVCSLQGYNGGGLTFKFLVLRSSAGAGETYIFDMAIRRIQAGVTELGASHSYAYNSVTVTIPAGPPAATIPMLATITFTDGADMDSLADGEFFVLRLRRDVDDTATDTARVLAGIIGIET